ncbi:DUF4269 domain-containing protein [Oceanobacillus polygoni]|uniref:DUF4269 domain-containing protein n=1 Tax=Oceanobacillus polygoni TaxID=1235259 RepID=A0A9X0YVF3_9BACI|nr:DUF4269 domain-containing protein [Oceanobacillus polygoni]MBP2078756.1 hypothetical protein [Oceanobacillus polygoni]
MFHTISYLKQGNTRQYRAYKAIKQLNILKDLMDYTPILCGTIPIGVDVKDSDLDIILEVNDFNHFKTRIIKLYGEHEAFTIKQIRIRDTPVIKTNFHYSGFEFELFGQAKPVHKQYAYLHMIIEYHLLKEMPKLREKVIHLKRQGMKTEPAFCEILGIKGDPYERLIEIGIEKGIIEWKTL